MPRYTVNYHYTVSIDVDAETSRDASLIAADIPLDIQVPENFRVYFVDYDVEVIDEEFLE